MNQSARPLSALHNALHNPGILALAFAATIVPATIVSAAAKPDAVDHVNVYIGTGSGKIGYGGTMPFVTPPFGMINWTPQTRQNRLSIVSYKYEDNAVSGFMGTHQPAIWMGDYGYITLMPEIGTTRLALEDRKLPFSHKDEIARPDYYSVKMDAGGGKRIRAEMTATERCSYMRFTFPSGSDAKMLIENTHPGIPGSVTVDQAAQEVSGYNPDRVDSRLGPFALPNFKGYFVVQFRQPFASSTLFGGYSQPEEGSGAVASFPSATVIEARIGTSFISVDQARANLKAEIPNWDFDAVQQKLRATWNDKLSRVTLEGATEDQASTVTTALYHALLYPRVFSEYGRYYSAFDDKVHDGESYTAYSIWDTFRAEHSLLTLVAPERIDGMITALLQNFKEGGWMPKWPNPSYTNIMIGTHADSMVAEALNKGFHGFDKEVAWQAVYKDAMTPPDNDTNDRYYDREPHTPYEARAGLTYMKQLGFIPTDKTAEAASRTLEDSYDDYAVAQVAKNLGKMDDYKLFLNRSLNYQHIFNKQTGFMQGKKSDGSWADEKDGWTEGDHWVYTFAVFHDIPGLLDLMGGRDKYNALLDQHFAGGHNIHSNEPSHHYGYLYDYSGEAWKTQAMVRKIANAEYANLPSGIDGDDDCGQMSAWYLFTALGFYPVNPASGDYIIGSPLFPKMSLRLANGKQLTVIAENNSAENVYIQSAMLNGKPLDKPVISYNEIMAGPTLKFVMGSSPSKWASDWKPQPISTILSK
jgi:predicted alpha-1,2-mannosidase